LLGGIGFGRLIGHAGKLSGEINRLSWGAVLTQRPRRVMNAAPLESLDRGLQQALLTRDVIGQAKGILMERLKLTPEAAFDLLRRSSSI